MKKLLGLLGIIMITGNAIPSVIATAPNRKHIIKKRQNNENISTTPKAQDEQQSQFLANSDSKVDITEKEITLNENYSDNIQKMLKEFMKNEKIDPLRMINNEGIITTNYFETSQKQKERKENIKIIEKLDKILELSKFNADKTIILILTLKNSNNKSIKLVINLNNFYLLGFINNQNQYFYFDDELLKRIKQKNKENIEKLEKKIKETSNKNELGKLNKNLKHLQGEGLKTEEIKTKMLNTKVSEKYNYQKINLNYTGAYSEDGLNVVIKEKDKPTKGKDIILSKDTLNDAILNLSKYDNNKQENQEIKDDLTRMIFITSEAMRFGSHIKYFNYKKNGKQVEFKNIPKDIQNIINSKNDDKIQWKNYSEQLIGGWVASSKHVEQERKKIFKELRVLLEYFEIHDDFLNNLKKEIQLNKENLFSETNKILKKIEEKDIPEDIKVEIKKNIESIWFATILNILKNIETNSYSPEDANKLLTFVLNKMKGWSLLHIVIKTNNLDIAKLLIWRKNELINKTTSSGDTPLHFACSFIEDNKEDRRKFLNWAQQRGAGIDDVNNILNNQAEIDNKKEKENNYLLIKFLLENGAHIDVVDNDGYTPLHLAAMKGHMAVVKFLLKYLFQQLEQSKITFDNLTNNVTIASLSAEKNGKIKVQELLKKFNKLNKLKTKASKKIKAKYKQLIAELLKIELLDVITQTDLGEIKNSSSENILNSIKELNRNLDISQVKIQENSITETSAIIESNDQNYYFGDVVVKFKITKKENKPNQSQIKITGDEYKKQGARPKGNIILNQVSTTQNDGSGTSRMSVGERAGTNGTQGKNSNQKQQNTMYDVPGDASCLFWSVATAYLLSVRNNNEEFKNRFIQLFGEENLKYLLHIQKLLKQYNLENNRDLNQLWYQDQTAKKLVRDIFRNRVVDYISDNLDRETNLIMGNQNQIFRNIISITENEIDIENGYLIRMRDPITNDSSRWGGVTEIIAISNILNSNIIVNNDNPYQPINQNSNNNIQIFHVNNGTHYNFALLEHTIEISNTNSQEKTTDIQNQQKLAEEEQTKTNTVIPNKATESNGTKVSVVNKSINKNIENLQTTTMKTINKYNALSKEEKQQKLNEINQHYQSLPENEKKTFKDKLRDVGLGLTSTGISGAGILGISKMTGISPIKGLSTTANYIKNSLSTTRTVVSSETGEAVEMTPLLSESNVAESLTAAETLSVAQGSAVVATEGAVIGAEAGTAAALAPETLGLSLVIGGLVIAGTAILWWINSDHTIVKHESHNQYNEIEKYYKFLAHDQLKLDININEWNKIKQIYQENSNNYQEFKNKIKSEINNFYKEDHSGWGGSIIDEDINTLINILYNHFQEINNHFSSNSNHGWKIVTNTIGSYFIIEEE